MNRDEKKLKKHFAQHALGFAVRKQRQKDNTLRKAMAPAEAPRERFSAAVEDWDELDLRARVQFARRQSAPNRVALPENRVALLGVALGLAGGRLRVWARGREVLAVMPGARTAEPPAPGDEVRVDAENGRVLEILPRRTQLVRPDPHVGARPRVIAVNVDRVVIVVPAGAQRPRVGLVDRLLLASGRAGCKALVCVSKADLVTGEDLDDILRGLGEAGAPVVSCSVESRVGLEALAERLRDGRSVLVGHSGAGKTSILNALVPGSMLPTGDVRSYDGKGRHTTSATTLVELPGGGQVLDTPGVRQFGLWSVSLGELQEHFSEIAGLASGCRFGDCRHDGETDCAVRSAAASGALDAARFRAYLRLLEECGP